MEWIGKLLSVHTGDTWYVGKEFFDMNEKEQKEIKAEEERIRENGQATLEENGKRIHLLSIIGEIEGHENLSGSTKTTKYEHILPELAKVESDETIGGVLILVNTIGGDVSCGLALAEMIASLSKPTVSLVIGDSHSNQEFRLQWHRIIFLLCRPERCWCIRCA